MSDKIISILALELYELLFLLYQYTNNDALDCVFLSWVDLSFHSRRGWMGPASPFFVLIFLSLTMQYKGMFIRHQGMLLLDSSLLF